MNLWIDDERVPPQSWTANPAPDWATTSVGAINLLRNAMEWGVEYEIISFDHDLGYNYEDGSSLLDGGVQDDNSRAVMNWMVEHDYWPSRAILVHSMNPIGAAWLLGTARSHAPKGLIIQKGPCR